MDKNTHLIHRKGMDTRVPGYRMNDPNRRIRQVVEAYRSAIWEKNAEALIDLYAADVRVFDLWGAWSYQGAEAWRKAIDQWFDSMGAERVRVTMEGVRINAERPLGTVTAIVHYAGISAKGEELRAILNRLSWVLKPDEGGWKIVHEHTSAPIGPHDGKVMLSPGK